MGEIDAKMVAALRKRTGAPMMNCKEALVEADADMEKAVDILRKKGLKAADARGDRVSTEGQVFCYVHHTNKLGVLVELGCETDFVARNEEFVGFGKDVCLHVAAFRPRYLAPEDVPANEIERERAIVLEQTATQMAGRPKEVIEKAVDGRMNKFFAEICLLEQPWLRDDKKTTGLVCKELAAKIGENIKLRRFVRMELGG
ncbi:MAG: translation elongation factor Ts [Planctomycetes bacterium]|nr:translation elongation factor Ts [Planctomycetota bacterium]